jgi:hypothetical protein
MPVSRDRVSGTTVTGCQWAGAGSRPGGGRAAPSVEVKLVTVRLVKSKGGPGVRLGESVSVRRAIRRRRRRRPSLDPFDLPADSDWEGRRPSGCQPECRGQYRTRTTSRGSGFNWQVQVPSRAGYYVTVTVARASRSRCRIAAGPAAGSGGESESAAAVAGGGLERCLRRLRRDTGMPSAAARLGRRRPGRGTAAAPRAAARARAPPLPTSTCTPGLRVRLAPHDHHPNRMTRSCRARRASHGGRPGRPVTVTVTCYY